MLRMSGKWLRPRAVRRLIALAFVVTASVPALHAACPGFSVTGTKAAGDGPWFVATGDFNTDGKNDIVVANAESTTVSVFIGNGDSTFASKTDYVVGQLPVAPTVAFLNGDTKPDIAVSHGSGIAVLLNYGDGTFATQHSYGTTSGFNAAADFDGDGDVDLAGASNVNDVFILLNTGNGTFVSGATYTVGDTPMGVVAADFNGDTRVDLAAINFISSDASILLEGRAFVRITGGAAQAATRTAAYNLAVFCASRSAERANLAMTAW